MACCSEPQWAERSRVNPSPRVTVCATVANLPALGVPHLPALVPSAVEKRFSRVEVRVPLQLIVRDHQAADKASAAAVRSLMLFPTGMHAVFLGKAHYGCLCQILGPSSKSVASAASSAAVAYRVRLETQPPKERAIAQSARHTLTAVAPQELRLHGEGHDARCAYILSRHPRFARADAVALMTPRRRHRSPQT